MAYPNHSGTLYIDNASGELCARAFAILAEIIFSAPLLSANRREFATNSRFFNMLCHEESKCFKFFLSWKSGH